MDSEHRHELQQNDLVEMLTKSGSTIRPYVNLIVAAFIVVLVIGGSWLYLEAAARQQQQNAWEAFNAATTPEAYQKLLEQYPDSATKPYILARLGDFDFTEGKRLLFRNKDRALESLDQAAESYTRAFEAARNSDPALARRVLLGLGMVNETRGNALKKAREYYERLTSEYPTTLESEVAQRRLELLADERVQAFYAQVASYETPDAPTTDLDPQTPDSFQPDMSNLPRGTGAELDIPLPPLPPMPPITPGEAPPVTLPPPPVTTNQPKPEDTPAAKDDAKTEEPKADTSKPADNASAKPEDKPADSNND